MSKVIGWVERINSAGEHESLVITETEENGTTTINIGVEPQEEGT